MAKYEQESTNPNPEPLPEEYVIPILAKFRSNTLNIAGEFTRFTQPGSAIRIYVDELYDWALSELIRDFRVNHKKFRDRSYSITLRGRESER